MKIPAILKVFKKFFFVHFSLKWKQDIKLIDKK